jgi:RNA polymerase sigma-70 factor, ECF subfamily
MEERIRQAQTGDETAFEQIVAAYAPLAARTALALLHDRAIAEDVVQDTWLNVWRALPRFDAARPFRPWLLTIVANSCRMILRRKALPSVRLEQVGDDLLAAREDLADHMIRSETDAALTAALAALPPAQRRLIELRYFARLGGQGRAYGCPNALRAHPRGFAPTAYHSQPRVAEGAKGCRGGGQQRYLLYC